MIVVATVFLLIIIVVRSITSIRIRIRIRIACEGQIVQTLETGACRSST